MLNPATFDFPIISEVAEGAHIERVLHGDPALEGPYVAAARRLVERGAVAITSTCGFSVRHQAAVAASVNVPVAMSSLLLIPTLLRQLAPGAKLAVLTYDSTFCTEEFLEINDPTDRKKIVIGDIRGGRFWHDELKRPPPVPEIETIEKEVCASVAQLQAANPEVSAILFECGAFPMVAPSVRRLAKVPIYDITTVCRMLFSSVG
ncbi:hypothetical protein [Bradyrhizobium sp. RDI18]|uniref:hypothetical protein n=1 Tax=Bradyrhizobium sp. RDI18 TaxID=3367400 RepID=UPI003713043A